MRYRVIPIRHDKPREINYDLFSAKSESNLHDIFECSLFDGIRPESGQSQQFSTVSYCSAQDACILVRIIHHGDSIYDTVPRQAWISTRISPHKMHVGYHVE